MKYKLDLEKSKFSCITKSQKESFNFALEYAIKNKANIVKVNRTYYIFNFKDKEVTISTGRKSLFNNGLVYKLKED